MLSQTEVVTGPKKTIDDVRTRLTRIEPQHSNATNSDIRAIKI
jgi:hypothetical protein